MAKLNVEYFFHFTFKENIHGTKFKPISTINIINAKCTQKYLWKVKCNTINVITAFKIQLLSAYKKDERW